MKLKKNCLVCLQEFETTLSANKDYCRRECYNKVRAEKAKQGWSEERKVSQGTKISKTKKDDPKYSEIAKNNIKEYNLVHKGKGNGVKHTESHKKYMSEIMLNRKVTWQDKIINSHWAHNKNREEVINKMNDTKSQLIADGKLSIKNLGLSGKYKSKKTSQIETYDSLNEFHRMKQLDEDEIVLFWTKKHGIKIPYIFEGKKKNYIPDFLIVTNQCKCLEEIKSSWTDEIHKDKNQFKKEAAELFCKLNNYNFNWISFDLNSVEQRKLKNERNKFQA